MKTFIFAAALLVSLSAIQSADARQKLRANETWCLETSVGGGPGGGGTINVCNFTTHAQCVASKVAQGDHCELNPVIAFEQWNKAHRR